MKTTLVITSLLLMGGIVSCNNTSTEECEEVCDSTKVGHVDSIQCVTTTECTSITDVSVTADSVR